jgi:hypothetical protein
MPFNLPKYTWDKDRELCKQCIHYEARKDNPRLDSGVMVMLCHVSPHRNSRGIGTCIDNRTRGPCGPLGSMFHPTEKGLAIGAD